MSLPIDTSPLATEEGLIASLTSPPEQSRRVTFDIAPSAIYKILLTFAAIWLLVHIFPVLILIVLSLMLVATFSPLVNRLQRRIGRRWALASVVTVMIGLFLGALALLIPPLLYQGYDLLLNTPKYIAQIQHFLAKHRIHLNVQQQLDQLTGGEVSATHSLTILLSSTLSVITGFATVAILTIYLLIEGPQVGTSLMRLLPKKDRLPVRRLVIEIGARVGGYMRGQLITSALAGLFAFTTLQLLKIPGALTLGALAAVADAIPLIGLLLAVAPAALIALAISPSKAVIVLVAYLIYHQLENYVISPKIYGGALGLSLTVIVISLLIGVELMGMMGALLALPVAAAIPCILVYLQEWQQRHSGSESEPSLP